MSNPELVRLRSQTEMLERELKQVAAERDALVVIQAKSIPVAEVNRHLDTLRVPRELWGRRLLIAERFALARAEMREER